ncbi:transcriptional regulatory protein [Mycobacterium tuberculosis T85]|nr:transcriptional regulatory protein [Mycobacterium tuberculosis T85]
MKIPAVSTTVPAAVSDGLTRRAIVRLLLSPWIWAGDAKSIGERFVAAGVTRGVTPSPTRLTAAGRAKLDHSYDDLASAAMRQLREIGGEEAVRTFARRRIDAILADVAPADGPDDAALEAAAERIATALSKAGYVATTTRVGGPIHGVQICQHHCPVSHVAEEFPELCETEQQAMAEVLGTHVQRLATIVNGDCACTTHVPLSPAPSPRPPATSTEGASR